MSQWFTRFGGAMFDGQVPPDFTEAWTAASLDSAQVVTTVNNYGSRVLHVEDGSSDEKLYRWTRPEGDDLTDSDQLLAFRWHNENPSSTTVNVALYARASGAVASEAGYRCGITLVGGNETFYIHELTAGTATSVVSTTSGLPTAAQDTWYWLRLQVIGSSLKAKWWAHGSTEPAWQLEATDSTHTAAGWVGPGTGGSIQLYFDYYSLGTEGDAPLWPTGPYSAVAVSNANTVQAFPDTIQTDASSFLVYVGEPDVAVDWSLTGDGTLTVLTDYTDSGGRAWAKYAAGTVGTKTISVTVGVAP